jgi:hypothetical protein
MGYKTSKEDFELYKQECIRWLDIFGMKSWYIDFSHELLFDGHEACANVDLNARSANLTLSEEWGSVVNDETVKLAAFHEVCEVFLAPLVGCAYDRFNLSMESIAENTHVIIQTLMNTMYRKY